MIKSLSKLPRIVLTATLLILFLFSQNTVIVEAISQKQKDALKGGARYFNTEEDGAIQCASANPSAGQSGPVFFIGDSLTVGMESSGQLAQKVVDAGKTVADVEATTGIAVPATITKIQGYDQQQKAKLAGAATIVIALGTNDGAALPANNFRTRINDMLAAIKAINSSNPKVFWMNAYKDGDASAYSGVNNAINSQSDSQGYSVIDWNSEAKTNGSKYGPFDSSLQVHPSNYDALASFVVGSTGATVSGQAPSTGGSCVCAGDGAIIPGSNNEEIVWNFFISKGLSATQVAGIMGNMKHESGIEPRKLQGGDIVSAQNISPSQLGLGWGIVQWTPASKVLDTFSPVTEANSLANQLNRIWGQLTRTGPLAEDPSILQDIKSIADGDLLNAVLAFQGNENGTAGQYAGNFYGFERPADEAGSVPDRLRFAEEFFRMFSGSSGNTGSGSSSPQCGGDGGGPGGIVDPNGYAYPVGPPTQSGGARPAYGHDQPHAFDFMRVGGTDVYAVYDGVIVAPSNNGTSDPPYYKDVVGCYRINFKADDGYMYWYGHLQNVVVRDGQRVTAGQKIAEVAGNDLGPVCHGRDPSDSPASHLHLDRGFPRGTNGGGGSFSRDDPAFIPLMQRLYDNLPN